MNDPTPIFPLKHSRSTIRTSLHDTVIRYGSMPISLLILLIVLGISVMIITGQPLAGLALILGIPVLLLLCIYPKAIVYVLIAYSFIVKFLVGDIGLGGIANYVCDGLLILALFFALTKQERSCSLPVVRILSLTVIAFWAVATLSAIAHGVSFGLYLWACRNTFRLFGILYCCVKLLNPTDVNRLIQFTFGFFWVNTAVCTYQHFVLGVGQDNTNGLFGTASGGNAMMNVLLFAVCAFSLFGFLDDKYSGWILILVLACSCYLAAIAELKFFYFELAILIICAFVSQNFSFRTLFSAVLIVIVIAIGIRILIVFNPSVSGFFNWTEILRYSDEGGYSDPNNLNRITAINSLDQRFMTTIGDKLFGLGFGAGQFSQFFASPLYAAYGTALDWNWFTDAAIFLETGYIGLILYTLPFVVIAVFSLRALRSTGDTENKTLMTNRPERYVWIDKACASMALLCLLLIVYNCTLTTDPGCYFVGYILSFPLIIENSLRKSEESNV